MKEYYLGLDMGTNSVGWAVTDKNYKIIRAKGKDLWGIREFDEASTSAERRTHRISRRRRQRELARIGLLKSYFADAINEVDPNFYIRLDNSKYYLEDKEECVRYKYGIFNDKDYTDVDYYKEFPTIFHLRKALIEEDREFDVRLIYLAILNMFKHRGHFLNASISDKNNTINLESAYKSVVESVNEILGIDFPYPANYDDVRDILSNNGLSRSTKVEKICELIGIEKKNKQQSVIIKIICGLKSDTKILFGDNGSEEKLEINFSDFSFEEKSVELEAFLRDDYFLINNLKNLYDIGVLSSILQDYPYLSQARVAQYDKHAADLKILKKVYKRFLSDSEYDFMFRSKENGTYNAYVNSFNYQKGKNSDYKDSNKNRRSYKNRKDEDLYKTIQKQLSAFSGDGDVDYILDEIGKKTFLPKQLTAANGVIPNQVHLRELRKILENVEKYCTFLLEKDDSGLTVSERIIELFKFHIPYYIGPISEQSELHKGNGWVVRKKPGQVLPWNWKEKIDESETAQRFITRMVRNCTYLNDEKVLPKNSLLYQRFCVLNELNNLKIDNKRISVELKQDIYNELFLSGKKYTKNQIANYLKNRGCLDEVTQLSGIDVTFNSCLSSYGKFYAIFGDDMKLDSVKNMVEDIIKQATIFGDSKKMIKDILLSKYGDIFKDEKILKRVLGYKFKDWGNLSREFLELKGCDKSTGEVFTLMEALWKTPYNLMELLNSEEFTFKYELEEKTNKVLKPLNEFDVEDLDEFYFSAPVKRTIWQTLLIIKELEEVLSCPPTKIFVEMTRNEDEKGDKGRKDSRKKQLLELYKNIKDESHNWKELIEKEDSSGRLRSKKMFLYLTQMGKCMYSGENIDLDDLFNDNLYDIDHIYPRHFVKDDNISNNLVLVKKAINNEKSDNYPLDEKIRNNPKVVEHWKFLHEKHLINDEKYKRLTGRNPFTDEQKAGFIARQLVETSQGTKGVADILKGLLPETDIIYVKASNVSGFRHQYDLLKSRIANDFHHAQDAYLNIVVGNVYNVKFTKNPLNFIKSSCKQESEKYKYHLSRMFDYDVERNGEIAWIAEDKGGHGTIITVKKMLSKNTPLMTRMNYVKNGGITNETLYGKDSAKADSYIPFKSSDKKLLDVTKYGGFSYVSMAYFFVVEQDIRGKRVRTMETVPVYLKEKIKTNDDLLRYCKANLGLSNPRIIVSRIKVQSLIEYNGYRYYLSGKKNGGKYINFWNAMNLCLQQTWINYIKKLENAIEKTNYNDLSVEKNIELYNILLQKHKDGIFHKRTKRLDETLQNGYSIFVELTMEEQVDILLQIIKATAISSININLSLIGGSKNDGELYMSKDLSKCNSAKLINQSVTGIYENTIDLLKV